MRYPKDRKKESRRRIVAVAAKEFRRKGIAAFGVGDAMKGAGLTKGAFSGHFSSKEQLVKEALHEAMRMSPLLTESGKGLSLQEVVEFYLQADHRDCPEDGCPAPSLVAEVARHPKKTRDVFVADLKHLLSLIESRLPKGKTPSAREMAALAIFSTMLGALQLSRVSADFDLSDKFLTAAKRAALDLAR